MQLIEKTKNFSIKTWQFTKPIITHKNTYRIFLPIVATLILLMISIPFAFDNSALKFRIEQEIAAIIKSDADINSQANFEINGDVDVSMFPRPAVTLNNVYIQNFTNGNEIYNFYARRVTIKSSFFGLIFRQLAMKEIVLGKMILSKSDRRAVPTEKKDAFSEILQHKLPRNNNLPKGGISAKLFAIKKFNAKELDSTNFPRLTIKDSQLISYNQNSTQREIHNINSRFNFSKNKITAQGQFLNQNILNKFELAAIFHSKPNRNKSSFKISSGFGTFIVTGDFLSENKGVFLSDFRGKLEGEIFDFKNFYKSYIANSGLVFNKINPAAKPIKINANITDNDGEIIIDSINLNSDALNGGGHVIIDLTAKIPMIDIRLDLKSLDLDSIWLHDKAVETKPQETAPQEVSQAVGDDAIFNENDEYAADELTVNLARDLRNFDLSAEISIAQITYLQEDIKNANLYVTISKDGALLLLPLTLEAPGGGLLRVNGALNTGNGAKFVGKIDIGGAKLGELLHWLKIESQNLKYDNLKEYTLYSDILITPHYATLSDLYININNSQSEWLGDVRIDYAQKTSNILSSFQINEFNLNDYFLTSGQNIYLSYGPLLKKLFWLNDFSSNNEVNLAFDKLTYNDLTFQNQSVKLRFGQGYFEIRDLKLKSDDDHTDLTASFAVDISGSDPKFDMVVNAKKYLHRSNVAPKETVKADSELSTILDSSKDEVGAKTVLLPQKLSALDQFFALPSLEGFSGKISIDIDDSYFDNLHVQDLKLAGRIKDGVIEFEKLNCGIFGGILDYSGSIALKLDKSFSGNLNLSNANIKSLLSTILDINNLDGTANITSSIVSTATKKEEFVRNLDSTIKLSAGNVTVAHYGLTDLVKKMFNIQNYVEDLKNPEKILFNPSAETIFKKATGDISIAKGRDDKFRINVSALAVNGIISGKLNLVDNSIDSSLNIVFLSGNRKKQTPLTIASNIKGQLNDMMQNTNLDQVKQYLGLMPRAAPVQAPLDANNQSDKMTNNAAANAESNASINNNNVARAPDNTALQQSIDATKKMSDDITKIMQNAKPQNPTQ